MARTVRAYIGLGANVGDARRTLADAVTALGRLPGTRVGGVSRLYVTRPVGVEDQPDFHNAVVALDALAGPDPASGAIELLVALKGLEREFGRQRRQRWGPREIDLDLLLFGRASLAIERPPAAIPASAAIEPRAASRLLEVPHPSMRERLFVLAPLADLAPRLVPPGWHETVETARRRRVEVEGRNAVRPVAAWSEREQAWVGPSGKPILIRRARPEDAEAAARAHTESSEAAYRALRPRDPGGLTRRTATWRRITADPEVTGLLAIDDGRVVGVASVGGSADRPGPGIVHLLYVLPAWWGSAAGQLLVDRAIEELARRYTEAELTVLTANPRARRFYERNGWVEAETFLEPHFGGTPTRVTRYRRRLPS